MNKFFLIKEDFANTRLDRWFRKNIYNIPQSLIEKNIRKGNIKVNNYIKKSSYKLQSGDKVCVTSSDYKPGLNLKKTKKYIPTKKDLIFSSDLFIEVNDNFVVINKPAGIAVQSGTKSRRNILDILRGTKEFDGVVPFPVHRIDKETTGILIVAKNRKYAQLFTSLFRIRKIHKIYLGIIIGNFNENKGTLRDQLYHYEGDKKTITNAITHFKVLDSNNRYTLIKLNPGPGRKHQLRKQLLIHGHPILGDSKYFIKKNKNSSKSNLMLHAYKINFSIADIKYSFTAPISVEFKNFLEEKYLKIFQ